MGSPIRSMTGFGAAQRASDDVRVRIEMRSVNQKNLRLSIRSRANLGAWEMELRRLLSARIERGQVDVTVDIQFTRDMAGGLVDMDLARAAVAALRAAGTELALDGTVSVSDLVRIPGIFRGDMGEAIPEPVCAVAATAAEAALDAFLGMREAEGGALVPVLLAHVETVAQYAELGARKAPVVVEKVRERLKARLAELASDGSDTLTQSILEREVCVFADRADINEEIARLRVHCDQFRKTLATGGAAGRRLEFLAQEMLREVNTMSGKGNDTEIASAAVEAKLAVESIKEQVMNLE